MNDKPDEPGTHRRTQPTVATVPPPIGVAISESRRAFLAERHLASLTIVRHDGRPHVTPVGFTIDEAAGNATVITWAAAAKVRHITRCPGSIARAAVCQVDGARWLTVEGVASVSHDPVAIQQAVGRYATRYRQPKQRVDRVVIIISIDRIIGNV